MLNVLYKYSTAQRDSCFWWCH